MENHSNVSYPHYNYITGDRECDSCKIIRFRFNEISMFNNFNDHPAQPSPSSDKLNYYQTEQKNLKKIIKEE